MNENRFELRLIDCGTPNSTNIRIAQLCWAKGRKYEVAHISTNFAKYGIGECRADVVKKIAEAISKPVLDQSDVVAGRVRNLIV